MTTSQTETTPLSDVSAPDNKRDWNRTYLITGIVLFIIIAIVAVIIGVTETMNAAAL